MVHVRGYDVLLLGRIFTTCCQESVLERQTQGMAHLHEIVDRVQVDVLCSIEAQLLPNCKCLRQGLSDRPRVYGHDIPSAVVHS